MKTAEQIVTGDLDYICGQLEEEFKELSGRRLLLTGGAGFLGYYLLLTLRHWNGKAPAGKEVRITIYDNLMRGIPPWFSTLEHDPNITFVKYDVIDDKPDEGEHFDYIIHAASIASPMFYRQHPIRTMDANINGLRNLLDFSLGKSGQNGRAVKGFLFFSSSEIYGDPPPEHVPTREEFRGYVSCTGPRACYDEAKRYGETLCVNFARQHGLPVKVARPFNNYGPGLKISDRRVIPDFARDILAGRDITLLSDGSPTRTYCYIADAVIGYYKILLRGRPGEAYNIGMQNPEISVADLAELMAENGRNLFGYTGAVTIGRSADRQYLTDNPVRRCPDISKAVKELGYKPSVGLSDGLERSMIWYRAFAEGEDA